jgi:hypothetical protein
MYMRHILIVKNWSTKLAMWADMIVFVEQMKKKLYIFHLLII